jgi:hypothetical protein
MLFQGERREGYVKVSIFWNITPCSPLKVNRRVGRALLVTCSHAFFFDPEDGGEIFL